MPTTSTTDTAEAEWLATVLARARAKTDKAFAAYAEHVLTLTREELRAHAARLGCCGVSQANKTLLYSHLGVHGPAAEAGLMADG